MARVSKKDLVESTTTQKGKSVIKETSTPFKLTASTKIFDKRGTEQEALPDDQIMAKFVIKANDTGFFVRINRRNELYNPYDKFYIDNSLRLARVEGTLPFDMTRTSKDVFDNYIQFLQTNNQLYLDRAQRGV